MEEELTLEKDMCLSTAPPASRLPDKMWEQDKKLETLACCFSKLGGHRMPAIKITKICMLVTKPD